MNKIAVYWNRYKELVMYLIFGVLTTLVNWIVYFALTRLLPIDILVANVAAWLVSVLFAYVTNKIWVFESKTSSFAELAREAGAFVGARVASGVVDTALLFVMVDLLHINDAVSKVVIGVIVVVMNYVLSKLFIFVKRS